MRINLDFRQSYDTIDIHRFFNAYSRLFIQIQAFTYNLSRSEIGIGRELEQYRFQFRIVEFSIIVEHIGSGVCIDYCANEIVEAVGFINIHHFTFHRERRCVDDGRTVFASMVSEDLRFIDRRTADASDIVGFRQHFTAHKIDGKPF